jgi:hypothetical protein
METLHEARDRGFPYRRVLRRAYAEDVAAVAALLEFSKHTDTAGAYFHCIELGDLERAVGRGLMARALTQVSADVRPLAVEFLAGGRREVASLRSNDWGR